VKSFKALLVAAICLVVVAGCVTFRSDDLPRYQYEDLKPGASRPSIYYSAKVIRSSWGWLNYSVFREAIDRLFKRSGLFSDVQLGESSGRYHVDLTLYNWGEKTYYTATLGQQYYPFLWFFTAGLLPIQSREHFILVAEVSDAQQVVKEYRYHHSTISVGHLFLLFAIPYNTRTPKDIGQLAIDDLLLNLLYDLQRDLLVAG
jgi:hypothetical protein